LTDNEIIDDIIKREGSYVNHSADKGGPTNHGITQATLSQWLGTAASEDDVKQLTEAEARLIYRQRYIMEPGLDQIHDGKLRALLVDSAVNHGPRAAIQMLQKAIGVFHDGVIGDETLTALAKVSNPTARLCAERVRFYGRLITSKPSQAVFAAGWANRMAEFIEGLA
jgi:lysozyme family protein